MTLPRNPFRPLGMRLRDFARGRMSRYPAQDGEGTTSVRPGWQQDARQPINWPGEQTVPEQPSVSQASTDTEWRQSTSAPVESPTFSSSAAVANTAPGVQTTRAEGASPAPATNAAQQTPAAQPEQKPMSRMEFLNFLWTTHEARISAKREEDEARAQAEADKRTEVQAQRQIQRRRGSFIDVPSVRTEAPRLDVTDEDLGMVRSDSPAPGDVISPAPSQAVQRADADDIDEPFEADGFDGSFEDSTDAEFTPVSGEAKQTPVASVQTERAEANATAQMPVLPQPADASAVQRKGGRRGKGSNQFTPALSSAADAPTTAISTTKAGAPVQQTMDSPSDIGAGSAPVSDREPSESWGESSAPDAPFPQTETSSPSVVSSSLQTGGIQTRRPESPGRQSQIAAHRTDAGTGTASPPIQAQRVPVPQSQTTSSSSAASNQTSSAEYSTDGSPSMYGSLPQSPSDTSAADDALTQLMPANPDPQTASVQRSPVAGPNPQTTPPQAAPVKASWASRLARAVTNAPASIARSLSDAAPSGAHSSPAGSVVPPSSSASAVDAPMASQPVDLASALTGGIPSSQPGNAYATSEASTFAPEPARALQRDFASPAASSSAYPQTAPPSNPIAEGVVQRKPTIRGAAPAASISDAGSSAVESEPLPTHAAEPIRRESVRPGVVELTPAVQREVTSEVPSAVWKPSRELAPEPSPFQSESPWAGFIPGPTGEERASQPAASNPSSEPGSAPTMAPTRVSRSRPTQRPDAEPPLELFEPAPDDGNGSFAVSNATSAGQPIQAKRVDSYSGPVQKDVVSQEIDLFAALRSDTASASTEAPQQRPASAFPSDPRSISQSAPSAAGLSGSVQRAQWAPPNAPETSLSDFVAAPRTTIQPSRVDTGSTPAPMVSSQATNDMVLRRLIETAGESSVLAEMKAQVAGLPIPNSPNAPLPASVSATSPSPVSIQPERVNPNAGRPLPPVPTVTNVQNNNRTSTVPAPTQSNQSAPAPVPVNPAPTSETTPQSEPSGESEGGSSEEPDVEQLAQEVYSILQRKLRVELERRGR